MGLFFGRKKPQTSNFSSKISGLCLFQFGGEGEIRTLAHDRYWPIAAVRDGQQPSLQPNLRNFALSNKLFEIADTRLLLKPW
ncbi:hypothetical protein ACIPI6_24155 [Pseudomonas protegens]|uniref:hypothetical protein n=1 Tax=Pseudomonas protegens TaxID=380021 RepID=UPI0038241B93